MSKKYLCIIRNFYKTRCKINLNLTDVLKHFIFSYIRLTLNIHLSSRSYLYRPHLVFFLDNLVFMSYRCWDSTYTKLNLSAEGEFWKGWRTWLMFTKVKLFYLWLPICTYFSRHLTFVFDLHHSFLVWPIQKSLQRDKQNKDSLENWQNHGQMKKKNQLKDISFVIFMWQLL